MQQVFEKIMGFFEDFLGKREVFGDVSRETSKERMGLFHVKQTVGEDGNVSRETDSQEPLRTVRVMMTFLSSLLRLTMR